MNIPIRKFIACAVLCPMLSVPGLSLGALIDRGGGLIYDTDLDITWLQNISHGYGTSYDLADGEMDGLMYWESARSYASDLNYYDSVRDVVYSDWRLPVTLQPDPTCSGQEGGVSTGFGCSGSELGHLFFELGGTPRSHLDYSHNDNYALFPDLIWYQAYWSDTEHPADDSQVFVLLMTVGLQAYGGKYAGFGALLVRDGDVAQVSSVPVPAAMWLFASGFVLLVGYARRGAI